MPIPRSTPGQAAQVDQVARAYTELEELQIGEGVDASREPPPLARAEAGAGAAR
jgi:hypothetical protein